MSSIEVGWINIFETSTITVTSAATNYPAYRLYDRYPGRMWKATSTADQTIKADQGATGNLAIDALVIPAGHNLSGCNLYWEYSTDDFSGDINEAQSWTQSGNGIISKTTTEITKRYWRLRITGATAAAQVGEIFMTNLYSFSVKVPEYRFSTLFNVSRFETIGGVVQYLKKSDSRRRRNYRFPLMESADYSTMTSWISAWDGSKPFVFTDHASETFIGEFAAEPEIVTLPPNFYSAEINILEVL